MPDGDRGVALHAVNDRLTVLQCRFHAPCLRASEPIAAKVYTASGDVASRLANHLCHGRDGNNDQRTYHDGVPHPRPRAIHFSSHHQKMSGYRSLETISPVGSPSKARVS